MKRVLRTKGPRRSRAAAFGSSTPARPLGRERRAFLEEVVTGEVGRVLLIAPGRIGREAPPMSIGLDSTLGSETGIAPVAREVEAPSQEEAELEGVPAGFTAGEGPP